MSKRYWFTKSDDDKYVIGTGDDEIAWASSRKIAKAMTDALNAMPHDEDGPSKYKVQNRVKEWRIRRELTQAELAERMNVTQSSVSQYETNERGIDLETLERLANALKVPPALLIGDG
jgi:DNA-binding XRE family transcriptional regulator